MKIVVLDDETLRNVLPDPWAPLREFGTLETYASTPPDLTKSRAAGAAILVANKVDLPGSLLKRLPDLRCVTLTAAGANNINPQEAAEYGIAVCNTPDYGTDSVAQHVFALLLELCRHAGLHDADVKNGGWHRRGVFSYWLTPQIDLKGKTLGIIGFGSIGRRTAELGHAFGMNVLACAHHSAQSPDFSPFAFVSKEELLRQSDIVSLHCPLTSETFRMIDESALSTMKHGALLINTARGPLADPQAVNAALRDGRLGGFGTDVMEEEPPSAEEDLYTAPNCIITPHLAWAADNARRRMIAITIENIRAFLAGSPQNLLNQPKRRAPAL
ncbi:MAG: D-2-hydroxyacid dehydrogenase [Desulfovibrionaceae bacterium]|nr:D-2-hydroxyacid dehydrogenase [Desulfovibrionaceae bacterium]